MGVDMERGRSKWEIISDILKVMQEEGKVKKTRIMQRAYLDWRNFQRYFDLLLVEGFITKCNPNPEHYEITEKGRNLSKRLKDVAVILDLNGSFRTKK
jgi:predicted transcriptional regulator